MTTDSLITTRLASPQSVSPFAGIGSFETAQRMAAALSTSTLLPEIYRGPNNIGNVLIALEMTQRIGCSFMTVAQNLHIIQGRPSFAASFLIASVNASGRFSPLRFEFSGLGDTRGCRAKAKDMASGEVCEGTEVTVAMAKSQGWFGRSGSKWPAMPDQMLMYRAAAFWVRIYCPELALGMHTTEELMDTPREAEKPEIAKVRVVAPEPAPFIPVPVTQLPAPADVAAATAAVPGADLATLRSQVAAQLKEAGITWGPIMRLAVASDWWDGADTRKFKDMGVPELEFLTARIGKITESIKAGAVVADMPADETVAAPTA